MKEFKKKGRYLLIYLGDFATYAGRNDYNTYCPDSHTAEEFNSEVLMNNRIEELGLIVKD